MGIVEHCFDLRFVHGQNDMSIDQTHLWHKILASVFGRDWYSPIGSKDNSPIAYGNHSWRSTCCMCPSMQSNFKNQFNIMVSQHIGLSWDSFSISVSGLASTSNPQCNVWRNIRMSQENYISRVLSKLQNTCDYTPISLYVLVNVKINPWWSTPFAGADAGLVTRFIPTIKHLLGWGMSKFVLGF